MRKNYINSENLKTNLFTLAKEATIFYHTRTFLQICKVFTSKLREYFSRCHFSDIETQKLNQMNSLTPTKAEEIS